MTEDMPGVAVQFSTLRAVNRVYLRCLKREAAARYRWNVAREMLSDATRNLKRTLQAMQIEVPTVGDLPVVEL